MHSLLDRKKKEAGVGIDLSPSYSLPQAARMFSCVGCFWVLLSSALVAICSFSFISPAWIVKDHLKNKDSVSFGLLWHCSESLDHMYRCYTFGGLGKFAEIPSSSWQTSAVLCSGGCALLAVSSLLAIVTIFLPSGGCERRICTLAGYMQMAADFCCGCQLLLSWLEFPWCGPRPVSMNRVGPQRLQKNRLSANQKLQKNRLSLYSARSSCLTLLPN
ncbi:transmembrane protein 211 isoform X2 [Esox lucius]|uniref:transmembrane protein 211 isoform X2 n=1 Tax=Esox lucius TaxID=8010 RepID=UPI0009733940|nr:transmembrane protein 211 isoform X2 [Esox lucius]